MKKALIFVFVLIFAATSLTFSLCAEESTDISVSAALSPALHIIAKDFGMAKAGLCGKNMVFSRDDFCRASNLSSVSSVTILSLPDAAFGKLLLGNNVVSVGQTVTRANLDLLIFVPESESEGVSYFDFSVNGSEYSLRCSVYMLKKVNASPSVPDYDSFSDVARTHSNTSFYGKLFSYDPEGDEVFFEILDYPENGLLILNDASEGRYTYLPSRDFAGKDEFTYTVKDVYGNYSAKKTVSISVERIKSPITYTDMTGKYANNSAIFLAEAGIIFGESVSGNALFEPTSTVTREDFVVMAMLCAGISDLPASSTEFFDDSDISESARPYLAAAKQLGYISGITDENGNLCFYPDKNITRGECALIINKMLDAASITEKENDTSVFSDADEISQNELSAAKNLNLIGILHDENGKINGKNDISRSDAALLLAALLKRK